MGLSGGKQGDGIANHLLPAVKGNCFFFVVFLKKEQKTKTTKN